MLNENSINAVNNSTFRGCFRKPLYDSYCFSNIPGTIERLLCGDTQLPTLPPDVLAGLPARVERVVLILVDAFGWRFLQRWKDEHELLRSVHERGVVSKLTSQYPSTTSAHVTLLSTGLVPAKSGVVEWYYYDPGIDEIICPLLFSTLDDAVKGRPEALAAVGLDPYKIFPRAPVFERLKERGVGSQLFMSHLYANSSYTRSQTLGAEMRPFRSPEEAFAQLGKALAENRGPAYFYLYLDPFDSACHHHGPQAQESRAVLFSLLNCLDAFDRDCRRLKPDTLILLTADHGSMEIFPEKACYLDEAYPKLPRFITRNKRGALLVPAGSSRNMFLHLKPGAIGDVQASLTQLLAGRALVVPSEQLIAEGLFGGEPESDDFRAKVGQLTILPLAREKVWWSGAGVYKSDMRGQHGGLSPEEMEIPLIAWLNP